MIGSNNVVLYDVTYFTAFCLTKHRFRWSKKLVVDTCFGFHRFRLLLFRSPDYPDTPDEKLSRQEQLRMMHLRSHLNQLTEKVKHHQYMTEKTG